MANPRLVGNVLLLHVLLGSSHLKPAVVKELLRLEDGVVVARFEGVDILLGFGARRALPEHARADVAV